VESFVSSSKMKPGFATMLHNELPISLTWHANCHVVRPSRSEGGYPSGCRLIYGGLGPKGVGGSSRMELGNPGETRETRRFILVRASGE
jgi:hypothetical protein